MTGTGLPERVQSPEERELELKRHQLAALEAELVDQELQLSTLQAELAAFKAEYLRVVGSRYATLDDLKARIAEVRAERAPADDDARAAATDARATADASAAETHGRASPEPVAPFDPSSEIKTLYRTIARRLHPDLAPTDDERERRHEWMAKINDAYQCQDSAALRDLLSSWEASPDSVQGTGVASNLVRAIRQIAQAQRRIESVQREIDEIKVGKLYTLIENGNARRDAGGNLLEEMATLLDSRIGTARQELEALETEA